MPSPKKFLLKINLLIHQGNPPQLSMRLMRWSLSSGKLIIMIVELVVVLGFVARFKLDADLADLHEKIDEQVPFIQSLKNDEQFIKQTQFQLATIKQVKSESPNWSQAISKIAELTPKKIKLNAITLDRSKTPSRVSMQIAGSSPSNLEISAFIKALQKDPSFEGISLITSIVEKQQISFSISAFLSAKAIKGGNP